MSTVPTITEHEVAKSRFQLAVECAPTAVLIANQNGEIILTNSLAEKLFGYHSQELLQRPVEVLVPECFRQGHPDLRREFFLHPQERPLGNGRDLYARRKDSSLLPVEIGLHPLQPQNCQWVLVSVVDITRRKQAEEMLRGMSGKLMEAQEQERRRIARELHDDINQRLALLAMDLQQLQDRTLSPEDVSGRAEELFRRTVEISGDLQALSHSLHSSTLEYLGLVPAIQSCCAELAKHHTLEVDFAHHNVPGPLPAETALGLFRVFQEALQNAARHSGVRSIEVRLVGVGGGVQLAIRDHGKGFDTCAALRGEGLGLLSMRERINLLKGTLSIVSKPGEGTEITAWVPAAAKAPPGRQESS